MHGDLTLGGPLWVVATGLLVLICALALFVVADGVRRMRKGGQLRAGRVALWVYLSAESAFLAVLVLAQVLPGVSLMSAAPVLGAPVALAVGVAYLLQFVFPRVPAVAELAEAVDAPQGLGESDEPAEDAG